jgi:hypothetical protein
MSPAGAKSGMALNNSSRYFTSFPPGALYLFSLASATPRHLGVFHFLGKG